MQRSIVIVGLGPGNYKHLSAEAIDELCSDKPLFLRTEIHPSVAFLKEVGIKFNSFDNLYREKDSFEDVYHEITETLIRKAKEYGEITYAVPGHPWIGEKTVQELVNRLKDSDIQVDMIHGISFLDLLFSSLQYDPEKGVLILDAHKIEDQHYSPHIAAVIMQVNSRILASRVKLHLMNKLKDDHEITVVQALGVDGKEKIYQTALYQLDHTDNFDHLTSVFVPPTDDQATHESSLEELQKIMEQLRSLEGCPWDREQTHNSLKPYLIEEAYEVAEAVDTKDPVLLCEELGDVLLQVVFHAQISSEENEFDMDDVIKNISEKMIRRHPHVFENLIIKGTQDVLTNWEKIKSSEKGKKKRSHLDGIPRNFPALMKAYKMQSKAARVGFDWESIDGAFEKMIEEIEEVKEAIENKEPEQIAEEIGDILFAVVNVARFASVEPEVALLKSTEKFYQRFRYIEEHAARDKVKLEDMTLEEMDRLWDEAKVREGKG